MGKYDLHVHTKYSKDSPCTVEEAIKAGERKGLNGVAITDHDSVAGLEEALKISRDKNFLVVPGIEVSSADGHILGLGIEEPVPKNLSASETVDIIRDLGGTAVAAHPFSLGLKPFSPLKAEFDAIEVFNSRRYFANRLAKKFALKHGIPSTAGSDAHFPEEIGLAGVKVEGETQLDNLLKKVNKGKASVFGRTLPLRDYLRRALYKFSAYW